MARYKVLGSVMLALVILAITACEDLQPAELDLPNSALTVTTASVPSAQVGVVYAAALDATGGTAPYSWGISSGTLPAGLMLSGSNSESETISGTPTTSGTFNFEVSVLDALSATSTVSLSILVQPAAPGLLTIQTTVMGDGTLNQAYSANVVATGGTSPYVWSLHSGTLPPGLTLAGTTGLTEILSGTPTATGTYNFTIRITDTLLQTADKPLSLIVNNTGPLTIQTASLPSGAQGVFYQAGIAASGGTGQLYVWAVLGGSLPPGLTLGSTGTPATSLAGTPTAGGTYTFSVVVTDSGGGFATRSFQVVISGPGAATQLEVSVPASVTAGVPFSVTVTARDSGGGVDAGYTGTVTLLSSDPQAQLPVAHAFVTGDAGVFTFAAAELRTAGNWNVSAGDGTISGVSGQIGVTAGAASQLVVSGLSGVAPLGAAVPFTVVMRDAYSNTATSYLGTVTFSSSDLAAVLPADYTFVVGDAGTHQFSPGVTFQTGGTQSLTATDTIVVLLTQTVSPIQVVTDVPPEISTNLPPKRLTVIPGEIVEFEVTVGDSLGDSVELQLLNPMPGMSFTPVLLQPGPVTRKVYWHVHQGIGGLRRLAFVAHDNAGPPNTTRYELELEILGDSGNAAMCVDDVTGDGIADVVCTARNADGTNNDVGKAYVWAGASSPSGTPSFTLAVTGAAFGDRLGNVGTFGDGRQALQLADLTGDGVLDIVIGASEADTGNTNAGGIYVWKGGASIAAGPDYILSVAGAGTDDRLGNPEFGQGILLLDVTGDGQLDVVALTTYADVGGVSDIGAIYVWKGGASLVSTPSFSLSVPGAMMNSRLGYIGGAQGIWVQDVTADGVADIVSGTQRATVAGVSEAGAIYIWKGSASIASAPSFTLTLASPQPLDRLGEGVGRTVQFADVSGDGAVDVLVSCKNRAVGAATHVGGVFVWRGGATFSANPDWSLQPATAQGGESIGFSQQSLIVDVTGDSVADVVACAPGATVSTQAGAGKIYVWKGGPTLANAPDWTLNTASPVAGDGIGSRLRVLDFTGDGVADIFAGAPNATLGGIPGTGAAFIWKGGTSLTTLPTFSLSVSGAVQDDHLGATTQEFGDVTGDGIRDILLVSTDVDGGGLVNTGAAHLWKGGPSITPSPLASMSVAGAVAGDELGWDTVLGDLTGDGILDVVMRAESEIGGVSNAGSLHVWKGGATVSASPDWSLTEVTPAMNAYLGVANQFGLLLSDVTGDGVVDLIAATRRAGPSSKGAVHVFVGGTSLSLTPDFTLQDSAGSSNSQMGYGSGQAVQFADWNGDDVPDILGVAAVEDSGVFSDTGAISFWPGLITASGDPSVKLEVPGAKSGDRLGG